MGLLNLFKKKKKRRDGDYCGNYIDGDISAKRLLEDMVGSFVTNCIHYYRYTDDVIRVINKYNEKDAPFCEKMSKKLAEGTAEVSEDVLRTLFNIEKNVKEREKTVLLTTRDMLDIGMAMLGFARSVGTVLYIKPDPLFDFIKDGKDAIIDRILSEKETFNKAYQKVRDDTWPEYDGTYFYPEPPTREQLSFYYDLLYCMFNVLNIPLMDYTDQSTLDENSREFAMLVDINSAKWIPELAPMINPENGQISMPDENGVFRPVEPDYLAEMKEIDFHGMI